MKSGWPGESQRHSMARKGVKTTFKTNGIEEKIPKLFLGLMYEARKYDNFNDFKKAFLIQLKHGEYWHITDNPDFIIDMEKGPRDLSSMSGSIYDFSPGKLMITSDLEAWVDIFSDRKYAVLLDFSKVNPKDYWQVNRGFGNEFWVDDISKIKIIKILSIKQALRKTRLYQKGLEKIINSDEDLYKFWEMSRKFG